MRDPTAVPSQSRTLHRLFLAMFLRGRSARGLRKGGSPKSVGTKLAITLVFYALVGFAALPLLGQPVFSLSLYLHAMTLVFLGMFIASSAGEMLFHKEEADILLHRPVRPRDLLRAKIGVLVQVSLWLAGAFSATGFVVGIYAPDGGWLFPIAHAISTALQALFCTSCVVLAYELCLRWFGRERLDALTTTVQVIVAIAAVAAGQVVPQLFARYGSKMMLGAQQWWIGILPPAWFASFDAILLGGLSSGSWKQAMFGLGVTLGTVWLAFIKLAHHYGAGLQSLGETATPIRRTRPNNRSWLNVLVQAPPFRWWLREPVSRASFLLTCRYLLRDRDVKLRIYPGLAPMLILPLVFLFQNSGRDPEGGVFGIVFAGGYLGLIPMLALNLLQYSQNWQAADVFRFTPMEGPGALCHGTRRAVLCLLTLPTLVIFGLIAWWAESEASRLLLLLPGVVALPLYALYPQLGGRAVPLSSPGEEAKSASRGVRMMMVMFISMGLSGMAVWARRAGWFEWLLLGESVLVAILYLLMRMSLSRERWAAID